MDNREILAQNLRKYRAERKISRETLAFESDVSVRQLNDIENAKCNTSLDTLDKLSAAINISSADLLTCK